MIKFLEFLKKYKFLIINSFLVLYFVTNFFDGNRGYLSFLQQKKEYLELVKIEKSLKLKNIILRKENEALTKKIDKNFIDELYRKNFVYGKKNEKLIILK